MSNENNTNKDIANSLSKYADYGNKGANTILDSVNQINKWYAEQLNKISEGEVPSSRLETNVDDTSESLENIENETVSKIETKVDDYNELQTNDKNNINIIKSTIKISTQANNVDMNKDVLENEGELEENQDFVKKSSKKLPKRISTVIKGAKLINNTTNKVIKVGKSINTGLNEGGLKSFENVSSRIMTKPVKGVASKVTKKVTNKIRRVEKKAVKSTTNALVRVTKLVEDIIKLLLSMLPSIAPIIIIILIIAAIGNFLNLKNTKEVDNINFNEITQYMIEIDDPNLQAIYNEFLKNIGKPYLMDHSNLKYDECMEFYDCSSWVIHCLAHCGIKIIPNTGATGIYNNYCYPVNINDRKAGDLIFLKDTYDTGNSGGISHVGIYMGELNINGENAEWVIDTRWKSVRS